MSSAPTSSARTTDVPTTKIVGVPADDDLEVATGPPPAAAPATAPDAPPGGEGRSVDSTPPATDPAVASAGGGERRARPQRPSPGLVYPTPPLKEAFTPVSLLVMLILVCLDLHLPVYPEGMGVAKAPARMLRNLIPSMYFAWIFVASGGVCRPWIIWVLFAVNVVSSGICGYLFRTASAGYGSVALACTCVYALRRNQYALFSAGACFGMFLVSFVGLRVLQNWGAIESYIPEDIVAPTTVATSTILAAVFRLVPSLVWTYTFTDDLPPALMFLSVGNANCFTFAMRMSSMLTTPEGRAWRAFAAHAMSIVLLDFFARARVHIWVLRAAFREGHWFYQKFLIIDEVADLTMRQSYVVSLIPPFVALPACAVAFAFGAEWAQRAAVWAAIPIYLACAAFVNLLLVLAHWRWRPVAGENLPRTFHRLATVPRQNFPDLQDQAPVIASSWRESAISRAIPWVTDDMVAMVAVVHLTMLYTLSGVMGVYSACYFWIPVDDCKPT